MGKLLLRYGRLVLGLFLFALGLVVMIRANIGYGPWEVFHVGLGKTLGMSLGTVSILVGFLILAVTLAMGEPIGIATVLNMIFIGLFIDLIMMLGVIPLVGNLWLGILVLIVGLYLVALGSYFYLGCGMGAGPRDGLMVALTRRTKLPIGVVRAMIEISATLSGWLLGGMVGIGTIIAGLAIGFCVQTTFRVLRFDPTAIRQATLAESFREIRNAVIERG